MNELWHSVFLNRNLTKTLRLCIFLFGLPGLISCSNPNQDSDVVFITGTVNVGTSQYGYFFSFIRAKDNTIASKSPMFVYPLISKDEIGLPKISHEHGKWQVDLDNEHMKTLYDAEGIVFFLLDYKHPPKQLAREWPNDLLSSHFDKTSYFAGILRTSESGP